MWWNGVYYREYRPDIPERIAWSFWKYIWILFLLSPYLFIPYVVYRCLDKAPDPALYILIFVIPGAFAVYYAIKYCLTRLDRWKKEEGGFKAHASFLFASLAFFALRVWAVQAGFALLLSPHKLAHGLSIFFAVLYAFMLFNSFVNRKFVYGQR